MVAGAAEAAWEVAAPVTGLVGAVEAAWWEVTVVVAGEVETAEAVAAAIWIKALSPWIRAALNTTKLDEGCCSNVTDNYALQSLSIY